MAEIVDEPAPVRRKRKAAALVLLVLVIILAAILFIWWQSLPDEDPGDPIIQDVEEVVPAAEG